MLTFDDLVKSDIIGLDVLARVICCWFWSFCQSKITLSTLVLNLVLTLRGRSNGL